MAQIPANINIIKEETLVPELLDRVSVLHAPSKLCLPLMREYYYGKEQHLVDRDTSQDLEWPTDLRS